MTKEIFTVETVDDFIQYNEANDYDLAFNPNGPTLMTVYDSEMEKLRVFNLEHVVSYGWVSASSV
jgi:hypothetical protein